MIRWAALLWLVLVAPALAQGEQVVAGLNTNRVAITANFDGSQILIFGAVKRVSPPPEGPLEVIVTVSGPNKPLTVRRKEKRFGMWVNTDAVHVDAAPSFYAVATTGPMEKVITATDDLRHRISIPLAIRSIGNKVKDSQVFTEALIRIRERDGLYLSLPGTVTLSQETLFSTSVTLPANLTEGQYRTRIFLTRQGKVVDQYVTGIYVEKAGLERFLWNLANRQPLAYGLLCLVIAVGAGWGAAEAFRYLRS